MSFIEYVYLGLLIFVIGIAAAIIYTRVAALVWFREKQKFINSLRGEKDGKGQEEEI